MFNHCDVIF